MERINADLTTGRDNLAQLLGEAQTQEKEAQEPERLSEEDTLKRLRKALEEIDDERIAILDRHHDMVAKSQKANMEYLKKKLAEKRVFESEKVDDMLIEKAIIERINARNRVEEDVLKRNLKDG